MTLLGGIDPDGSELSIMNAIKKKLSIAQQHINVPVETEVNVGVKHRLASKRGALKETNLAS